MRNGNAFLLHLDAERCDYRTRLQARSYKAPDNNVVPCMKKSDVEIVLFRERRIMMEMQERNRSTIEKYSSAD